MKIGWWRILGIIVLATTMPNLVRAQEYESIIAPRDLGNRLEGALGRMSSSDSLYSHPDATPPGQKQPVLVQTPGAGDDWAEGPAPVKSAADLIDNGLWYGDTDFTVMHRTRVHRQFVLGVDRIANISDVGMTTRDRPMGIEPGARLTIGRFFPRDDENRDRSFEFTFQGLNTWDVDDSLRTAATGNITTFLGDAFGGFQDADEYKTHYHSTFNSYEFNYRLGNRLGRDRLVLQPDGCWQRECEPAPIHAALWGLRLIQINEKFEWHSRRDDVPPDQYRGDYFIDTENTLLGLQFGVECYDQYCNWSWGLRAKGGIYSNFSSQSTHVVEMRPNTFDFEREVAQSQPIVAFVGETGLMATYQLSPRWTLHAGYDFMFIQDLALAPEQITFDLNEPSPQIANHGWVFYQSLSIGVEYVW